MESVVTAFVVVSPLFVVSGNAESYLSLRHYELGGPMSVSSASISPSTSSTLIRTFPRIELKSSVLLGKCSHSPVSSLTTAENHVLATSGLSASLWNVVKRTRVRHFSSLDIANCADFVTPQLLAVAGNACHLSLFDVRSNSSSAVLSKKIASDNLYGLGVDGPVVYCGGADGDIYKVDLRNQTRETWKLWRKDAILDLKVAPGDISGVMVSTESGKVCCVESSGSDYKFTFDSGEKFTHRVKCDVAISQNGMDVACGGEKGHAYVFQYDGKLRRRLEVPMGGDLVASVSLGQNGLFASTGSEVVYVGMES